MNRIVDFEKFRESCSKYDRPALKALLWEWAMQRILHELVLVKAINNCKTDGSPISAEQNLVDLDNTIQGERILINLLGRKEAAKVYGLMEEITSDVKTVDFVLETDFITHYQSVLNPQQKTERG